MAYKIVPSEVAHKIKANDMVGRRVMLAKEYHKSYPQLVGKTGIVKESPIKGNIKVVWEHNGSDNNGRWDDEPYAFDLVVDDMSQAEPAPAPVMRFVPDDEARKLTAKQIIGRRVVYVGPDGPVVKGTGVVKGVPAAYIKDDDVVEVRWDNGQTYQYAWGFKKSWPIKIISEELMKHTIMPKEQARELTREQLVSRRVVRGSGWNSAEDGYDNNGKSAGVIVQVNSDRSVVYVRWDWNGEVKQHFFNRSNNGNYEVEIVLDESAEFVTNLDDVRPYDPNSKWERPNTLVMALFSGEFVEARKSP